MYTSAYLVINNIFSIMAHTIIGYEVRRLKTRLFLGRVINRMILILIL